MLKERMCYINFSAPAIYYDAKSGVDKERTTPSTFTVLENG